MPERPGNKKKTSAKKASTQAAVSSRKTTPKTKKPVKSGSSTSKTAAAKSTTATAKGTGRSAATAPRKVTAAKKPKIAAKKPSVAPKTAAAKKATAGSKKSAPAKKPAATAAKPATKPTKKTASRKASANKAPAKKTTAKKAAARKPSAAISRIAPPFEPYKGKRPYAFVSYAHGDMRDVFRIIGELNRGGFRLWYDEGIEPGNEWPEVVGKALLNASQIVVFMSPAANHSRNVRNEINLAFSENKDLIVILIEETNMSDGMKLQMGSVQQIRYRDFTAAAFMDRLKRFLYPKIKG